MSLTRDAYPSPAPGVKESCGVAEDREWASKYRRLWILKWAAQGRRCIGRRTPQQGPGVSLIAMLFAEAATMQDTPNQLAGAPTS